MNTIPTEVSTQAELDAALAAKATRIRILGEWENVIIPKGAILERIYVSGTAKVGSIYVYGTVTGSIDVYGTVKVGSIYVYGTVTGSIYVSGTVTGSIYVYVTAEVGSIYVSGTAKVGSIDVSGTAKVGSIYVYGTVTGSIDVSDTVGRKFFGLPIGEIKADHLKVLELANPVEIAVLRAALISGKIDGKIYEGECKCLVGTLEGAEGRKVVDRNSDRPAEKWYMGISRGNTSDTNFFARTAVTWIDEFLSK